jgi:cyclopropane fatty-acyl-phospholipid synthase-like methyltransferase
MDWDSLYQDPRFRLRDPNDEVLVFAHHLEAARSPRVLDVGFGAGRHVVYLARKGYRIHEIDVSERGKEFAERWLAEEGLTADLRVADMRAIPYPEGFFSAVMSIGVITHCTLPEMRKALGEMARVTEPGGLALCTFISTESSLMGKGTRIDDTTWICDDESEAGVVHYFMAEDAVVAEVEPYFEHVKLRHVRHRGEIDTGRPYVSAHWVYLGRRLNPGPQPAATT